MSDSAAYGLQRTRLLCPSLSSGVCSNSSVELVMPSNHLILCRPLLLPPQSVPASGSFPMSQLFSSGGQTIGAPVSASVLPVNIQAWLPKDWLVWSPCCPRDSQESFPTPQFKSVHSSALSLYGPALIFVHDYWKKTIALTRWTFVGKMMSLLFNMLFRFVIAFLPRSKHLLISRLQSPFSGPQNKICHSFHFLPIYLPWTE